MKKRILAAALCAMHALAIAQSSTQKAPPGRALAGAAFSMKLLEKAIPPNFTGMDPKALIESLVRQSKPLKQGEFETNSEFEERLGRAYAGNLLGRIKFDDKLVFTAPVVKIANQTNGFGYKYDPETERAHLVVAPKIGNIRASSTIEKSLGQLDSIAAQFDLVQQIASRGSYVGVNGFGAQTNVEKVLWKHYGILAGRSNWYTLQSSGLFSDEPLAKVVIQMDPVHAARELPRLKVLMVAELDLPFYGTDQTHNVPTRSSPYDYTIEREFLNTKLLGIVFYSGISGEILARLPADFGAVPPAN